MQVTTSDNDEPLDQPVATRGDVHNQRWQTLHIVWTVAPPLKLPTKHMHTSPTVPTPRWAQPIMQAMPVIAERFPLATQRSAHPHDAHRRLPTTRLTRMGTVVHAVATVSNINLIKRHHRTRYVRDIDARANLAVYPETAPIPQMPARLTHPWSHTTRHGTRRASLPRAPVVGRGPAQKRSMTLSTDTDVPPLVRRSP